MSFTKLSLCLSTIVWFLCFVETNPVRLRFVNDVDNDGKNKQNKQNKNGNKYRGFYRRIKENNSQKSGSNIRQILIIANSIIKMLLNCALV